MPNPCRVTFQLFEIVTGKGFMASTIHFKKLECHIASLSVWTPQKGALHAEEE
jgi:hypothetical protein